MMTRIDTWKLRQESLSPTWYKGREKAEPSNQKKKSEILSQTSHKGDMMLILRILVWSFFNP